MVQIRRIHPKEGDQTTVVSMAEATKQVETALKNGELVIDETKEEQSMLQNALNLKETSKLRIHAPVAGG